MKLSLLINGREDRIEITAPAPACRFRLGETRGAAGVERDASAVEREASGAELNARGVEREASGAEPEASGVEREASVEFPQAGVYSVLLDGRSYDAYVEETPSGMVVVVIDGYRFEIEARDPRRWSRNLAGRGGDKVQALLSPMPGKIVRVMVAADDTVEAGQGIVVVEAMKMQNELKATRAGTVLAVLAKEGATVAAGELLATIE